MRGVSDELPQPILALFAIRKRLLDLHQHVVQGQSEATDLRARGRRCDSAREVTVGNLPRDPADPLQRPEPECDHDPSQHQQSENHSASDQPLDFEQPVQSLIDLVQRNGNHKGPAVANRKRRGAIAQSRAGQRVDREDVQRPGAELGQLRVVRERGRRAGPSRRKRRHRA